LLLTFGDSVEYKPLGVVCDYVDYRGKTPRKVDVGIFLITAKNIRKGFIDYNISREYIAVEDYEQVMKRGKPNVGDVLITTEAPCGNVAQLDRDDIALAQRVIKYRGKKGVINNSYLKYVLLGTEFQMKLLRAATGGTVKGIKGSILHKLAIPVPPLEEQERIVAILDRFDALCNDLTSGIPAEIEARQKQYEYYRDKLLSFKEVTA
jgi:type I restriction enzyme S subunit